MADEMFDEMREAGSSLPAIVEYLTAHGWTTYKHHDNWVMVDWSEERKSRSLIDTHKAFSWCKLEQEGSVEEKVGQMVGLASMCWNPTPIGVFDSSLANDVTEDILRFTKLNIKNSIQVLIEELKKDQKEGSYFHSWQANIAMAFVDAYNWKKSKDEVVTEKDIHSIANDAAVHFLNLLIK